MKWLIHGPLLLLSSALASGCGTAPEPVTARAADSTEAPAGALAETPNPAKGDSASPTAGSIRIDERILARCGDLPTPRFAFDSAAIRGEAADTLRKVAACFTSGPLAAREMKLVGRADPRGGEMYNIALGEDRAASVVRFLTGAGVDQSKLRTMSKGALEATGTDSEGWARDRRVDILLVD